jgi:uncharacterized protein YutE (UPF0331/DUF86 family)
MKKEIYLLKLNNLKDLYNKFKDQYDFFKSQKEEGFLKTTALLALQKRLEEVIEYSIKINKILLSTKNTYFLSYQESFLLLSQYGLDKELANTLSKLAIFRNKLAHEYLNISDLDVVKNSEILLNSFKDYFNFLFNFFSKVQ